MYNVDFTKTVNNVISICSGSRGIERGIERTGMSIREVCFVEIEAFICENLVKQMENGLLAAAPIFTDVKQFLPWAGSFRNKVHGITGGYPCQPFSIAGIRSGTEDTRHLWPYIADIIKSVRPVWCFFENVDDHISLGLDQVQADLWKLGYAVEAGIYSASEVGSPHERQRVFILAVDHSCKQRFREEYKIYAGWNGTEFTSEEYVANANSSGLQGRNAQTSGGFSGIAERSQWPSPRGEEQYSWEEPRVESRMVFSINGYNFREDLLRMAGNAVVEQTAEKAFRELIKKHTI